MNKLNQKNINIKRWLIIGTTFALGTSYFITGASAVETPLTMGTASSYAILSSAQTTSVGTSTVTGTAGRHIGAIAGAHTGVISGYDTETVNDTPTTAALTAAGLALAETRTYTSHLDPLGGETLTAGAYAGVNFNLGGVLTLDGQGVSGSVFIFRTDFTLITASGSSVKLINGAQACNVFWQVGSSVTLGTSTSISGHIIADVTIADNGDSTVNGQLIARTGAVTLIRTAIVNDACVTPAPVVTSTPAATPVDVPTPLQRSVISSCDDSATASEILGGNFLISGIFNSPVTNISVDGRNISNLLYTQTDSTISIAMAPHAAGIVNVQIYNGQAPLLASCTFEYVQAVATPVPITPPAPLATLHIIKKVVNSFGGTSLDTSFVIHVTQNGSDLPGSPSSTMGSTGRTFMLPAGTYLLKEDGTPGYRGVWSGSITFGGIVQLVAGEETTVTRTNFDVDSATSTVVITETPTATAPTETGGVLPTTSSPWGSELLLGAGFIVLGAISFRMRKFLVK